MKQSLGSAGPRPSVLGRGPWNPVLWGLIGFAVLLVVLDVARLMRLPAPQAPLTNGFEAFVAALVALACAFAATRRSEDRVERLMWWLVGLHFASLSAAGLHDMMVGVWPDSPTLLLLAFLGWLAYVPLALMVIAPSGTKSDSPTRTMLQLVDFLQAVLVLAVAYFAHVYLPHFIENTNWQSVGRPETVRNLLIFAGLLTRAAVDPRHRVRRLVGLVAVLFLVRASLQWHAFFPDLAFNFYTVARPASFMILGIVATQWPSTGGSSDSDAEARWRMLATRSLVGGVLAVAPLFVGFVADRHGDTWHFLWPLLAVSVAFFLARTVLAEHELIAEAASLRGSEERYRSMFELAANGILQSTFAGKAIAANPALVRMLGYSSEQEILTTLTELPRGLWAHPEERAIVAGLIEAQGSVRGYECEFLRKDGERIWVSLNASVARGPGGSGGFFQGSLDDITARKRTEAEKAGLEAQLQQAQKLESVGRLAGGVAHDFNNMLSVILGYTDMALSGMDPSDPLYPAFTEIEQAGNRSAELTRQLLTFARKQIVAPKVLDLNEVSQSMLTMLRRLIGEDIDLVWRPGADIWPVKVDPAQIDQMLANLCVNARDAISGVGQVTIETENVTLDEDSVTAQPELSPGDFVMLAVSDDGCGMADDTKEHIFEPFYTTKAVGEGTGLGLATVYGIAKQSGGFVTVHSEVGEGTTFKIYLPRHVGDAKEATGSQPDARPRGQGETVLMVEDEATVLKVGSAMLKELGYTVLTAGTPGEALALMTSHAGKIDLLMTDVVMPEMNGRELAEQLQSQSPGLRCLFVSGYTADVILHRGVLNEGVQFLQKPFTASRLAVAVKEALEVG